MWKLIQICRTPDLLALVETGLLDPSFRLEEPTEEPEPDYEGLMRHDHYRRVRGAVRQVGWSS